MFVYIIKIRLQRGELGVHIILEMGYFNVSIKTYDGFYVTLPISMHNANIGGFGGFLLHV